jgi:cytochrome d ubiquinol oxidase subunit II
MFITSSLLAILWGVALSNLIKGVPIDGKMNYIGGFFDLISLYTLVAGITTFLVFTFHGAIFLSLKTTGAIEKRAKKIAGKFGVFSIISSIVLILLSYIQTDLYNNSFALAAAIAAVALQALSLYMINKSRSKWSLFTNGLSIALGVGSLFLGLFPRVMVSSLGSQFDLTIYNASSSPYTLALMTKVAIIFVPIVLVYQAWTYWIFRKRVTVKDLEY